MSQVESTKCYIEEYEDGNGRLSARLREKTTGRKVDLGVTIDGKQDFLQFLGAARQNRALMPEVFSKDGDADSILVSGEVDFDAPDEIRFIFNPKLSYFYA